MSTLLKNELINWLKPQPYWLQYAGNLLMEDTPLTDPAKQDIYNLVLEDHSLKAKPSPARVPAAFTVLTVVAGPVNAPKSLAGIKDVINVNALAPGQQLPIGPGLTIVYGNNGAGKSGYIRLLNNAFNSRGDKQILHNIYGGTPAPPAGKFIFKDAASSVELKYPDDKSQVEFTQFSIFDTYCQKAHLEQDNKLNFTPLGFQFFDQLLDVYQFLRDKLSGDTTKNRPANALLTLFINENLVKEKVAGLSGKSKLDEFKLLGSFTEKEVKELEVLNTEKVALQSLNITKKVTDLQTVNGHFKELVTMLKNIIIALDKPIYDNYQQLLKENKSFFDVSKAEGLSSFKDYKIEAIGSKEWKDFLKAAQTYSSLAQKETGDNCLLCLRPLREPELKLMDAYWHFLKSVAEENYKKSNDKIDEAIAKLKKINFPVFDETSTVFNYIKDNLPVVVATWQQNLKDLAATKQALLLMLEKKDGSAYVPFTADSIDFDEPLTGITIKIDDLLAKDTSAEIAKIDKAIALLNDKNVLSKVLDQVEKYISQHAWAAKADTAASSLRTNSLTAKQGELFAKYITVKYTDIFNEECTKLKAPKVVNIQQKNAKGQTLRKLQVSGHGATQILSEGEQRSICIADFLTEAQMNPNNTGVVFDDPVSSLDHERRERIARRFVEFSTQNQVVIFTHDIAFYTRLNALAIEGGVDCMSISIRRNDDTTGLIYEDIPWIASGVNKRIKALRNRLVEVEKAKKTGDADVYLFAVKGWYVLLRETWERLVEEKLLCGVVERFAPGVSTLKLKKLQITPEMLKEVETGMTESSNWVHDSAAGLNPDIPDLVKAKNDLDQIDKFNQTFKS
jgi:energy-coupling factor transporter ATP-binding protein EcfA2